LWIFDRPRTTVDQNRQPPKRIPIRDLKVEPEVEQLLESTAMEPYMNLAVAMMGGTDPNPAILQLLALPLEQRYVWRVVSALKWAFADFDTVTVDADRQTLSLEDRNQLIDLLKHRPLQFCLFLSALLGQEDMELMMLSAIKNSRTIAAQSQAGEQR